MTKSTTPKARKTTAVTVKLSGVEVKATRKRRVKPAPAPKVVSAIEIAQAPVAETPVVEVPKAEAPMVEAAQAETVFVIPDLGTKDLTMSREGHWQLPGKTWHKLSGRFGKEAVREAIRAMISLDIRLTTALELATWPGYRAHMVQQLAAVRANQDTLVVLTWIWGHQGWSWGEAYAVFPRTGFAGCTATKAEIGKLNKLVQLMDNLRKEGKTSISGLDFLAQGCHLLGWIK